MKISTYATRKATLALIAVCLGVSCGSGDDTVDRITSTGLEPGVEAFSVALGAGWSADSSSAANSLEDYVEGSDAVVEARLVGVSDGPVIQVDEQPDSPTLSFVYVRFQPVDTITGELRTDAASEIRIEYPRPPGATAAALEELIPGQPNAILFIEDPRATLDGFSVPHVYLATGEAGIVLESNSQNSPLVVLANDASEGTGAAFGYDTFSELSGAIAVASESFGDPMPTNSVVPAPLDATNSTGHVRE